MLLCINNLIVRRTSGSCTSPDWFRLQRALVLGVRIGERAAITALQVCEEDPTPALGVSQILRHLGRDMLLSGHFDSHCQRQSLPPPPAMQKAPWYDVCFFMICFFSPSFSPFCFLSLLCLCPFLWSGIHMHILWEAASLGCTSLSVTLGWPGLPWINCYGAYWSKLMQAFRHKEGAQCRKCIVSQCAAPIAVHALVFRVISLHWKPAVLCAGW